MLVTVFYSGVAVGSLGLHEYRLRAFEVAIRAEFRVISVFTLRQGDGTATL